MTNIVDIEYQVGLPEHLWQDAAALYEEAFRQKFTPILRSKEKRIRLLEKSICPEFAIVALQDDKLLGVCGFHDGDKSFTGGGKMSDVFEQAGPLRGLWALLLLSLLERKPDTDELLMDGIVVDAAARGHGVGTGLLERLVIYAEERGLKTIRLDVVDTNPAARRLYERKGFAAMKTEQAPYLRKLMGFSAATTMVKTVSTA